MKDSAIEESAPGEEADQDFHDPAINPRTAKAMSLHVSQDMLSKPARSNTNGEQRRLLSYNVGPQLGRYGEPKIVHDHSVRPDWHLARIRQIELMKHTLVSLNLAKEVFEDIDC